MFYNEQARVKHLKAGQHKTSLETRYADASQNTKRRRQRHTDVGSATSDEEHARHVKAWQQSIRNTLAVD